jgi:hypothetical protein
VAIILTGHHRSGTSILGVLCNSHPDIRLTNEFGNFLALGQPVAAHARFMLLQWWNRRNVPFTLAPEYPRRVRGTYMLENLVYTMRYLNAIRRRGKPCVDASAIDAALHALAPQKGAVGDKHPDYVFKLARFANLEAVHCLFIYRDPRDLASSVVHAARTRWRQWFPPELREARHVAERWVQLIELWQRHADKIHGICYEELVTRPQAVLQVLGERLGVDPGGFQHEMIRPSSIGKYRTGLSAQEVQEVLAVAGPTMRRLSYQF